MTFILFILGQMISKIPVIVIKDFDLDPQGDLFHGQIIFKIPFNVIKDFDLDLQSVIFLVQLFFKIPDVVIQVCDLHPHDDPFPG